MNRPDHPYGDDAGSTRVGRDTPASGTGTGADVTGRMSGTSGDGGPQHAATDRPVDGRHDTVRDGSYEERRIVRPAKTSAAATFGLVFGLAALFCALTAILAPAAVVFGLIGLILGVVGLKMARRVGVTGKGVAIGGLVTAVLGLLLGLAVMAGAAVFVNDEARLDQLQTWIDDARGNIPSGSEVVEQVPGNN
ncbi:MAG TPA: DUF4190 domain-containing protein [Mycobacteriales bacterium]|nr:DUF4190 domain-containing protein [Mycobacteriales bacterium]